MSDCADVRERLSRLLDDRLPHAERLETESHLASCPACAAEHDSLRASMALLLEADRRSLDPELVDRTVGRAARRRRWIPVLPAAAAALLLAWLTLMILRPGLTPEEARGRIASHARIMDTFARQVANLEGRDPRLDLALVQAEMEALRFQERTEDLAGAVELVPEAREYVLQVACFIDTITDSVQTKPADLAVLCIRNAARSLEFPLTDLTVEVDTKPIRLGWVVQSVPEEVRPYTIGRLNLYQGKYEEARVAFTTYLQEQPDGLYRNSALVWLAESCVRKGDLKDATLNFYSALTTPQTTWVNDAKTILSFQNACEAVGSTAVNGQPIETYSVQDLTNTLQKENFVTIYAPDRTQHLLTRSRSTLVENALQKVKNVEMRSVGDAVILSTGEQLIENIEKPEKPERSDP